MIANQAQTVGVIGSGTMGRGIAQVFAQAGYQARMFDVVPDGASDFPEDAGGAYVNTYVVATTLEEALKVWRNV